MSVCCAMRQPEKQKKKRIIWSLSFYCKNSKQLYFCLFAPQSWMQTKTPAVQLYGSMVSSQLFLRFSAWVQWNTKQGQGRFVSVKAERPLPHDVIPSRDNVMPGLGVWSACGGVSLWGSVCVGVTPVGVVVVEGAGGSSTTTTTQT